MNLQQPVYPQSFTNGFVKRKVNTSSSGEHKLQPGKSNPLREIRSGIASVSKGASSESLARDRLVYLTTCLIGHHVDVQVKNGSMYSGIFHATSADKDFGIVLKMALLTKEVSFWGQKSGTDSARKAPSKILIIPGHELVQIVAKDVPVTRDGLSSEFQGESQQDIMIDSYISQSKHVDVGRELKPWVPDEDALQRPELENIFDSSWTGRSWDQFKANEALFGVKSTFNEELYTTKLEKGPRMKEREVEASRIAREIEGEETYDLHLAEERGAFPPANSDLDEETKYSSVFRGFDDSGDADEEVIWNPHVIETVGGSSGPGYIRSIADATSEKCSQGLKEGRASSGLFDKEEMYTFQINANVSASQRSDTSVNTVCGFKDDDRAQKNHIYESRGNNYIKETSREEAQIANSDDLHSSLVSGRDGFELGGLSSVKSTASTFCTKIEEKTGSGNLLVDKSAKIWVIEPKNSCRQPGSASSMSESGADTTAYSAAATPVLSPSSSMGSLSSEKSTLNPNVKEFRLNPKATSFVPTPSLLRPVSPVNDASFYYPSSASSVPHMHAMPVGIGVGPSFATPQPVLFNPQAETMQSQQAYYASNGPQYAQHMIIGHPNQVMYMPGYPAGRDY